MIVEQRTYSIKIGKIPEYLKAVETLGLPVMLTVQGGLIGYYTTEMGTVSEIVHLWAYDSLEDRAERRKRAAAHPDWPKFLAAVQPLIDRMETRILVPAAFSPLGLEAVRNMNKSAAAARGHRS